MGLTTSQHVAAVVAAINEQVRGAAARHWRGVPAGKSEQTDRIYLSRPNGSPLGYLYVTAARAWELAPAGNANYRSHARDAERAADALGPAPKEDVYAAQSASAVAHGGCGDCQGCMAGGPCDEVA